MLGREGRTLSYTLLVFTLEAFSDLSSGSTEAHDWQHASGKLKQAFDPLFAEIDETLCADDDTINGLKHAIMELVHTDAYRTFRRFLSEHVSHDFYQAIASSSGTQIMENHMR